MTLVTSTLPVPYYLNGLLMNWTAGAPFPAEGRDFSLFHSIQTGSGPHPASYLMGTEAVSPGVKLLGRESDHSPSSAEVTNDGPIPPLSHTSSWDGA
jgi:hypothetical protein